MGIVTKHFAGIERNGEHIYANVYSNADSANAAEFLRELIENIPNKLKPYKLMEIRSLRRSLKKLVRSLKFHSLGCLWQNQHNNGKVKRSNRIFREEFYDDLTEDTITGSGRELEKFV